MYIVYDVNNSVEPLRSKYLVLELDTIEFLDGKTLTAFAIVDSEHIPFQEIAMLENLKNLHDKLIQNYRKQDWNFCGQALDHLNGRFKGELDSFYTELGHRINKLESSTVKEDWTGNVISEY